MLLEFTLARYPDRRVYVDPDAVTCVREHERRNVEGEQLTAVLYLVDGIKLHVDDSERDAADRINAATLSAPNLN